MAGVIGAVVFTGGSGKAVPTSVTLGVVGDVSAQVSKGLAAGEQIILADTSEAVPSSNRRGSGGTFSGLTGGAGRFTPGAGGPLGGN